MADSRRVQTAELVQIEDEYAQIDLEGYMFAYPLARIRKNGAACKLTDLVVGCPLQLTIVQDELVEVAIPPSHKLEPFQSRLFRQPSTPTLVPMELSLPTNPAIPEELLDQYTSGVLHYSKRVFPIALLKRDYNYSQSIQSLFSLVETRCVGVRKCSAGDRNGMLVALAIAYIDHLARRTTPIEEVVNFQQQVARLRSESEQQALRGLGLLIEERKQGKSGMQWMAEQNRNSEFWRQINHFLSVLTNHYVKEIGGPVDFLGDMTPDTVALVLATEEDADIPLKVLARALNLKIIIFSPEVSSMKSKYGTEEVGKHLAYIYLFREGKMYHVLYSQAQLEAEGYDLERGAFGPIPSNSPDPGLLYCFTKPRYQLPSHLLEYQESGKRQSLRLMNFSVSAQDYIVRMMTLVERKEADREKQFYSQELAAGTLLLIHEFSMALEQLDKLDREGGRTTDGFVDDFLERLQRGPLKPILERKEMFDALNLCSFCHEKNGKYILDCRHSYCQDCISKHVAKRMGELPFMLKPNGETVEEFVCPSMTCFIHVSGAHFKEIVGEEYYAQYLHWVEETIGKRKCKGCLKTRSLALFQTLCRCGLEKCMMCYCQQLRLGQSNCECGAPLSTEALKALEGLSTQCASCGQTKSTQKDFTAIECEEHILCEDCLSVQWQGGRCPSCYRVFSTQEQVELQTLLVDKNCIGCGVECRKLRLNTLCGCIICKNCATYYATERNDVLHCPSCGTYLTNLGINQLMLWVTPALIVPIKDCIMCYSQIMENSGTVLPCGEEFHTTCLADYFDQLVESGYSDREFPCPNITCVLGKLSSVAVQYMMAPSTWEKYQINFNTEHTMPCPRCTQPVEDQDENGGRKGNLFCKNPDCKFTFCTACKGEFKVDHDEKRCQFNKIQAMVQKMEEYKLSLGGEIGQCPNCKTPCLKGDGCDDLTCTQGNCKTNFCVQCSTPSYLFKEHGAAWHRPSCPNYAPGDRKGGMNVSKCKACMTKGGLCAPPKDLQVRGRFTFEES